MSPTSFIPSKTLVLALLFTGIFANHLAAARNSHLQNRVGRPNIVLINLDDAEAELFQSSNLTRFPNIKRLADQGMRFSNCHVTSPICAPSRYSLLRGQYAHHTGLRTNKRKIDFGNGFDGGDGYFHRGLHKNDLGTWLQDAGYRTMLVGKYYQGNYRPIPKRGWDDFRPWMGNRYHDPVTSRFQNGKWRDQTVPGFRTDLESNDASELISEHALRNSSGPETRPFFMYLAPIAPHFGKRDDEIFAKRHQTMWPDLVQSRNIVFNLRDTSHKESAFTKLPKLNEARIRETDQQYRSRMLGLKAVDEMLGKLFDTLRETDQLKQTLIVFTSDHGFLMGHYRHIGKQLPVQRATQIPLLIWGPGIKSQTQSDELVGHIDITATILDIAGAPSPDFLDGVTFESLLSNSESGPVRESLLIENWQSVRTTDVVYSALRTKHEMYTEWATGERSYYDLRTDPYQLENAFGKLTQQTKSRWAEELRTEKRINANHNPDSAVVTIARPFQSRSFVSSFSELSGFAEDVAGVSHVDVQFKSSSDQYWNGSDWEGKPHSFRARLTNRNGVITKWILPMRRVVQNSDKFRTNKNNEIVIDVISHTQDRIKSATGQRALVLDSKPPEVTFTRPRRDKPTYSPFSNLGGLISDDNAPDRVDLEIQNKTTGEYFDGIQWQPNSSIVPAFCNPTQGRWHYRVDLPNGRYEITAYGFDAAGMPSKPNRLAFDVTDRN